MSRYGPRVTNPRASGRMPKQLPSANTEASIQAVPATATARPAVWAAPVEPDAGGCSPAAPASAAMQATNATGSRAGLRACGRTATSAANVVTTAAFKAA